MYYQKGNYREWSGFNANRSTQCFHIHFSKNRENFSKELSGISQEFGLRIIADLTRDNSRSSTLYGIVLFSHLIEFLNLVLRNPLILKNLLRFSSTDYLFGLHSLMRSNSHHIHIPKSEEKSWRFIWREQSIAIRHSKGWLTTPKIVKRLPINYFLHSM